MTLSLKAIADYKAIYEKEFNEKISDAEAKESAERVMRIFMLINKHSDPKYDKKPEVDKKQTHLYNNHQ
ncbi:MAG: hypothetical protein ABIF22_00470 [bacterium]